jgi:hypothetical protein
LNEKQPTHLPTHNRFAQSTSAVYSAVMASWTRPEVGADRQQTAPDVHIQSIGRGLPRVETPEGWVKKVDRARDGKVWVGYFHAWETTPDGKRVRRKKEKTLGAASKPRHEALKMLADYIAAHTGKLAKQGPAISTFAELWRAFRAVKAGQWSTKTRENLECLFAKHVLPIIGSQRMRDVTLTSLQLLVNKLAADGYSKSVVAQIRTYLKSSFGYAVDEDLIQKSPARKLVMPKIRKKACERFLTVEEFRALLSHAAPREHLVLRILGVCGLRRAKSWSYALRILKARNSESTKRSRNVSQQKIGLAIRKQMRATTSFPSRLTSNVRSRRGLRGIQTVMIPARSSSRAHVEPRSALGIT